MIEALHPYSKYDGASQQWLSDAPRHRDARPCTPGALIDLDPKASKIGRGISADIIKLEQQTEGATCKDYLQVRLEGSRQVSGNLRHYRMEAILAVGYSVPSHRAHWGVRIGVRSEYLTNWLALAPVVSRPGSLAGGHHSAAAVVGCPCIVSARGRCRMNLARWHAGIEASMS